MKTLKGGRWDLKLYWREGDMTCEAVTWGSVIFLII